MLTFLSRTLYKLSFLYERKKLLNGTAVPNIKDCLTSASDYGSGFEIQNSPNQLISWDSSFKSISENTNALVFTNEYGNKELKFKSRIRVGNYIFSEFKIHHSKEDRDDVPIRGASIYIESGGSPKNIFHTLYASLLSAKNAELIHEEQYGIHNADCDFFCVNIEGIEFSLSIDYNSAFKAKSSDLILSIENKRKYNSYLKLDFDLNISDHTILGAKKGFWIEKDFRKNIWVKNIYLPDKRFEEESYLVRDDVNKKLIFACANDSLVFGLEEINCISLQRIQEDRFSDTSKMWVHFKNGQKLRVFNMSISSEIDLKMLTDQLKSFTPIKIERDEDGWD